MRHILFLFALLLAMAFSQAAFALSDAEYVRMMSDSAKFREENRKMGDEWNSLKAKLKGERWQKALREQQEWLASGRDQQAEKYQRQGYARAFAYARATHDRCAQIWAMKENADLSPEDIAKGEGSEPGEYDAPSGSLYGSELSQTMGWPEKIIPLAGRLAQIHMRDSFGHENIYYYERKTADEQARLARENPDRCHDLEPWENGQLYQFEFLKEIPTPEIARTFGEKRPAIRLIGNFGQCFS